MYCPHCAAQNPKETKFCRGCGEDLRLVSQAVTKSLPLVIAHRVDDAIRSWSSWLAELPGFSERTSQSLCSTLFVIVFDLRSDLDAHVGPWQRFFRWWIFVSGDVEPLRNKSAQHLG
jgi:hypothetical protein